MLLYVVCLHLIFSPIKGIKNELSTLPVLENRILDLIEQPIQYYLNSNIDNIDINFMLGVSIMRGQFMSCIHHPRVNNFNRMYTLTTMINDLYAKFYEKNSMDMQTISKILEFRLWTSPEKVMHKSQFITLPKGFNENYIANGDSYFRNISDKCIGQVISTSKMTKECVGPELIDGFFGYALTHQVLYLHILKKVNENNTFYQKFIEKVIHNKCSNIFNEAVYINNNFKMLKKYNDLFIEQIAVCGMQNMVEFVRPEWFSIVSSKNNFGCIQYENNNLFCDSHLTGVSLAALGVYWKFQCYKANTHGRF